MTHWSVRFFLIFFCFLPLSQGCNQQEGNVAQNNNPSNPNSRAAADNTGNTTGVVGPGTLTLDYQGNIIQTTIVPSTQNPTQIITSQISGKFYFKNGKTRADMTLRENQTYSSIFDPTMGPQGSLITLQTNPLDSSQGTYTILDLENFANSISSDLNINSGLSWNPSACAGSPITCLEVNGFAKVTEEPISDATSDGVRCTYYEKITQADDVAGGLGRLNVDSRYCVPNTPINNVQALFVKHVVTSSSASTGASTGRSATTEILGLASSGSLPDSLFQIPAGYVLVGSSLTP